MKKMIIAAAALTALASTAFAADLPARVPARVDAPLAPVRSWTGCYVGAGGGYGVWNQDHTTVTSGTPVPPGYRATTGGRGWLATAQFGCDYQFDRQWVVGLFGDGNWGGFKGDYQDNALPLWGREKEKWAWAGGGRVGFLIYPQLLTFASAGYTQARFDQVNLTNSAGVFSNILPQNTYSGWFLGTGYEYQISWAPGLTWKTEYRWADYGNESLPILTTTGASTGYTTNIHKYEQTLRSQLNWRF
jgi:outer membrane immunogenic protein